MAYPDAENRPRVSEHFDATLLTNRPRLLDAGPTTVYPLNIPRQERREPDTSRIRLVTNDGIQALGERLQTETPNWGNIKANLLDSCYRNSRGDLAEAFVRQQLAKYTDQQKDRYKIPELDGKKTENFKFERLPDRKLYVNRDHIGTASPVTDIDAFMKIDGQPTLIEVKLLDLTGLRKQDRILSTEEWYRKKLEPFQELYERDDFGFVIVTIPEFFQKFPQYKPGYNHDTGIHFYMMNTTWQELDRNARAFALQA